MRIERVHTSRLKACASACSLRVERSASMALDPTRGENGEWIADDELLKPACYNSFSTLNITKQNDGSYLLDLSETFEDRSYEQQLNEDLSNLDEVMPDNTQSSTRTKWIFKNGQFKQIFREE